MTIVYHGTSIDNAIGIAKRGAILSPLQQAIEEKKEIRRVNPKRYDQLFGSPEQSAERQLRKLYSNSEWEHRVLSVSVVVGEIGETKLYALKRKENTGGVVLGVEVEDNKLRAIETNFKKGSLLFIPDRLELELLREVHLSTIAYALNKELIEREFVDYNPAYFLLESE